MVVRTGQGALADGGQFFNAVQHSGEGGIRVACMGADEGQMREPTFVALVGGPSGIAVLRVLPPPGEFTDKA